MHQRINSILLIITVCVLILGLVRTWDLSARVDRLTREVSTLRTDLAGLRADLHSLEQAARWYSRPELSVAPSDTGCEVQVRLGWTFHELSPDAAVTFSYRIDDGGWTEVPAHQVSGLTYAVTLSVPVAPDRPHFHITLAHRDDAPHYEMQHIPVMAMTYVISAQAGGQARSGEPEVIDISKIGGYFTANMEASGADTYSARVVRTGGAGGVGVVSMELIALDGETVLGAVELDSQNEGHWEGSIRAGDASALAFIVHWADGTVSDPVRIPLRS